VNNVFPVAQRPCEIGLFAWFDKVIAGACGFGGRDLFLEGVTGSTMTSAKKKSKDEEHSHKAMIGIRRAPPLASNSRISLVDSNPSVLSQ